ncbi:MAG: hypothetical protein L3J89_12475 [Gammaproteobacteria bacterium]|nr:hypothetical protein [Gammaproteobacteria bacterium]
MYCSNCGSKEGGNYCSKCGAELAATDSHDIEETDWSGETNYSKLLRIPEVRDLISIAAQKNRKNLSIEELFDLFGDSLKPLAGGISLGKLAAISKPVSARFGINIKKKRCAEFDLPPGKMIVKLLCLFAELGQKVIHVEQADDGCLIEAEIPSDILSWKGTILVMVKKTHKETLLDASTKIEGQMFDFGKSERLLDKLFKYIDGK